MARKALIERDKHRRKLVKNKKAKREALVAVIKNKETPMEDRFQAVMKLAQMSRDSSKTRISNRCELTGRSRGYYRKFRISRIALRELAAFGQLPGVIKSSW